MTTKQALLDAFHNAMAGQPQLPKPEVAKLPTPFSGSPQQLPRPKIDLPKPAASFPAVTPPQQLQTGLDPLPQPPANVPVQPVQLPTERPPTRPPAASPLPSSLPGASQPKPPTHTPGSNQGMPLPEQLQATGRTFMQMQPEQLRQQPQEVSGWYYGMAMNHVTDKLKNDPNFRALSLQEQQKVVQGEVRSLMHRGAQDGWNREDVQFAFNSFAEQTATDTPTTTGGKGTSIIDKFMDWWGKSSWWQKAGMIIGIPLALFSLFGATFGDQGMSGLLLGAAGLGAAAFSYADPFGMGGKAQAKPAGSAPAVADLLQTPNADFAALDMSKQPPQARMLHAALQLRDPEQRFAALQQFKQRMGKLLQFPDLAPTPGSQPSWVQSITRTVGQWADPAQMRKLEQSGISRPLIDEFNRQYSVLHKAHGQPQGTK